MNTLQCRIETVRPACVKTNERKGTNAMKCAVRSGGATRMSSGSLDSATCTNFVHFSLVKWKYVPFSLCVSVDPRQEAH